MFTIAISTFAAVLFTTLLSLIGILFFVFEEKTIRKYLLYAVSLSTGALLGDVFIHILPEMAETGGDRLNEGFAIVLGGIVFSFCIEKIVHWHHCHVLPDDDHHHDHDHHHVGVMSLVGEAIHNFIDGVVIAAAFLASIPLGISTTLAVVLHEIPHEVGNYAVLRHSGFSHWRAVMSNASVSTASILGAAAVLLLGSSFVSLTDRFLPFAAGNLLYIAGSDLIPELHKESRLVQAIGQLLCMLLGIGAMLAILMME